MRPYIEHLIQRIDNGRIITERGACKQGDAAVIAETLNAVAGSWPHRTLLARGLKDRLWMRGLWANTWPMEATFLPVSGVSNRSPTHTRCTQACRDLGDGARFRSSSAKDHLSLRLCSLWVRLHSIEQRNQDLGLIKRICIRSVLCVFVLWRKIQQWLNGLFARIQPMKIQHTHRRCFGIESLVAKGFGSSSDSIGPVDEGPIKGGIVSNKHGSRSLLLSHAQPTASSDDRLLLETAFFVANAADLTREWLQQRRQSAEPEAESRQREEPSTGRPCLICTATAPIDTMSKSPGTGPLHSMSTQK